MPHCWLCVLVACSCLLSLSCLPLVHSRPRLLNVGLRSLILSRCCSCSVMWPPFCSASFACATKEGQKRIWSHSWGHVQKRRLHVCLRIGTKSSIVLFQAKLMLSSRLIRR